MSKALHMVSTFPINFVLPEFLLTCFSSLTIHLSQTCVECMGKYLMAIVEVQEAEDCFLSAYRCYVQWGAIAKAKKLHTDWNLDSSTESIKHHKIRHERDD